jgi:ribosome maturation factor RimP
MIKQALIENLFKLIEPIVNEKSLELYHLEYVKEFGENFLRIYIDSPNGITLDDCEKVSRPISDMLDEKDPISESYYLEVSSPGIERILYNEKHFDRYVGNTVLVQLEKLFEGKKKYIGNLIGYNQDEVILEIENTEIKIPRDKIKSISLNGEV